MRTSGVSRLGAMAVLCAVLAACGGGGGGGGNDKPADVAGGDPIDKYLGALALNCDSSQAEDAGNGAVLYQKETWTSVSKASSSKALFKVTTQLFDANDCSGTPRATQTVVDANTFLNVDGTGTASNRTVDKISGGTGAIGGLSAGGNVVVEGIRYPGEYFTRVDTFKQIVAIDTDNNIFTGDTEQPRDAQGYPTVLVATPTGKKQ